MKELGCKYGAAGTINQSPNLHEIMAAQSGWNGQRQTPKFASPQAAEGRHSQISVPKTGAKVVSLGGSAADSEKPGGPLLSAQKTNTTVISGLPSAFLGLAIFCDFGLQSRVLNGVISSRHRFIMCLSGILR